MIETWTACSENIFALSSLVWLSVPWWVQLLRQGLHPAVSPPVLCIDCGVKSVAICRIPLRGRFLWLFGVRLSSMLVCLPLAPGTSNFATKTSVKLCHIPSPCGPRGTSPPRPRWGVFQGGASPSCGGIGRSWPPSGGGGSLARFRWHRAPSF